MIQPMSHYAQHGLNGLIAGIRCNFFSKLVEGAYVHIIARRQPRRLL